LVSLGFVEAKSDTFLFVYHRDIDTTYLLLYVDDIVLLPRARSFSNVSLQLSSSSLR
jgi:hypothetical protein